MSICAIPPCFGKLEPFLNNIAVGTFDFARSNRQICRHGALVIELLWAIGEVPVTTPDRCILVGYFFRFAVWGNVGKDLDHLAGQHQFFLLCQPDGVGFTTAARRSGRQVASKMHEINEITSLFGKDPVTWLAIHGAPSPTQ